MTQATLDPEMAAFEDALLRSLAQAQEKTAITVHTPESIQARKAGRPRGSRKTNPKVSTTLRLSADVVEAFRATGDGWQTRIDAALREWLQSHPQT